MVDFGQGLATKDQVQMAVEHEFQEQGIEFALPKREVRLVSEPPKDSDSDTDPDRGT